MKRWLHYVKPYLAYFIIGPICMIVEVIGEVIMPKLLSNLIDYLTNQTTDTTVELSEFAKAVESIFGENYIFVITLTAAMIITATTENTTSIQLTQAVRPHPDKNSDAKSPTPSMAS